MVIKENFYDINGENLHITSDCPAADKSIVMPDNYVEIIKIASSLSEDFPFVRVDIYSCSGKNLFWRTYFYVWSEHENFNPDRFDSVLGKDFEMTAINAINRME